jgi:pSer/pThr/pTyr-binding forkhead associated (FHA) protein
MTAYITTRLKMREEREKWRRDFSIKLTEAQASNNTLAQKMAMQFGIGVLKFINPETSEPHKMFVPPNSRIVVGRHPDSAIYLNNPQLSRFHCAFIADETNVYIEELGATMLSTFLNWVQVKRKSRLKTGDVVEIGGTEFLFYQMEKEQLE